ncbi:signal peptide peptidase SppA [Candidatus Poribacteria bacterium]|nr:signal peptide peptidase SppA [Candidatus Poribacteria bacterium]
MITGKSFVNPFTGGVFMGSDTITGAIRSVREDNSIKAVVLRIDSGGGFVLAADEIWRELQLLKQVGKPLIVSMGDTAASGGYYIATLADQIIAEPSTVTGSIGVFTGRLNLKGLYDKIGIKKEIIKRGKNADFYSDYSDYSETHRQAMRASVEEIYDGFVAKVADGRGMTKEEVDQVARGRVWTGRQAHKIGLVDQLGGLDLALSVAREKAGLMGQQVELVSLPQATWLYGLLNNILSLDLGVLDIISRQKQVSQQLSRDRVFLMASYNLHVRD